MASAQKLETQTTSLLNQAVAAYEMAKGATMILETLPVPVLQALREYAKDQVKDGNGPRALGERHYVEYLDKLIVYYGMTGVVPSMPNQDGGDKPSHIG